MKISDFDAAVRRTLYVSRPLLNGDELQAWAKSQGFPSMVDPADLHVTLAHSRKAVAWESIPRLGGGLTSTGGERRMERLGDGEAVVLRFEDEALHRRWQALCAAGCAWRWPGYKPHVTITFGGRGLNLSAMTPYAGRLLFGPERFRPVTDGWADELAEIKLT